MNFSRPAFYLLFRPHRRPQPRIAAVAVTGPGLLRDVQPFDLRSEYLRFTHQCPDELDRRRARVPLGGRHGHRDRPGRGGQADSPAN